MIPNQPLQTGVYRLTRTEMARLASLEYLRTFWWVAVGIPLGGIIFLIIGHGGPLQVIGFFALMWPFSIPARAVMVTSSSSRLFVGGVTLTAHPDHLEFQGQTPGKNGRRLRMELPRNSIRDIAERGDFLLVRTWHFGFVPVARSAFATPEEADRFVAEAATSPDADATSS